MRVSGRVVFAFLDHVVRDRKQRRVDALRRKISWAGKAKRQLAMAAYYMKRWKKIQAKIIAKVFGKGRNFTTFATSSKYYI